MADNTNYSTSIAQVPPAVSPYSNAFLQMLQQQLFPGAQLGYTNASTGAWQAGTQGAKLDANKQPLAAFNPGSLQLGPYGQINPNSMQPSLIDQKVAPFNPAENTALSGIEQQASAGSPLLKAAENQNMATQEGYYLNPASNPYLNSTFNEAAQQMSNQYRYATVPSTQAEFARAGSFGGSAQQQTEAMNQFDFGNNLTNLATNIYGGNYNQERQNQLTSEAQVPGLMSQDFAYGDKLLGAGQVQQAQTQQSMDTFTQNMLNRYYYPQQALNQLGAALGLATGTAGSTYTTQPNANQGNLAASLLGGGLGLLGTGAQAYFNQPTQQAQPQQQAPLGGSSSQQLIRTTQ